jgi:hypothetical protein
MMLNNLIENWKDKQEYEILCEHIKELRSKKSCDLSGKELLMIVIYDHYELKDFIKFKEIRRKKKWIN